MNTNGIELYTIRYGFQRGFLSHHQIQQATAQRLVMPHFFVPALLLLISLTSNLFAGENFQASIESADGLLEQNQFDAAVGELETAFRQADNDTQRGIALGKQAEVHSYNLGDHDAARELVKRSLALANAQPVARVTALKILARCQIEADNDHAAAIATLHQAATLRGVDWAQPTILLMLGDSYRAIGKHEEAIKTYRRVPRVPDVQETVSAIAYLNTGIVYQYDLRQLDRAKPFFDKALEMNPSLRDEVSKHLRGRDEESDESLILAHYMPWYTAKPFSDHWGWHWTMNHFDPEKQVDEKREVASKFYPLIGPYDSGDPDVLEYHLLLMKLAGIEGVIVDWYGLTDYRDYAILHRNTTRLLEQCERLKMKFVICYEDQTIPALVDGERLSAADRVSHAVKEIEWLGKYWFKSGSYVKLNEKPLLLSFGHAGLTNDEWSQCLSSLTLQIAYFSQDIRRDGAIGGFGWPSPRVGMQQVDRFLTQSKHWPQSIPAAFPRFDDIYSEAGVSKGYPTLPENGGQTLKETLEKAINSKAPIIQITTWNDWGEGTQIEPTREAKYRDLEVIQESLFRRGLTNFQPDDLSLPIRVFEIRRSKDQHERADDATELLVAGKLAAAKKVLKQIDEAD